jgi:IS30 family transposase
MAQLTESEVQEIRAMRAANVTRKEVAARFGVHKGTISAITSRRIWKHS